MSVAGSEQEKGGATPRSEAASRLAAKRAAKAAAKASKRGTSSVPPAMAKGVLKARSFYEDNARLLLGGLGVGVLAAIATIAINNHLAKQGREASTALLAGIEATNAPVIASDAVPTEDDSDTETFPTAKARAEKAHAEYGRVIKGFSDSKAASWARLGDANALRELGKPAEAAKLYERLLANSDLDPFLRARAAEGAGFALEAQQKFSEASARFEQLAELDGGAHKPLGDYHRARMLLAQGQKQKAAELLGALVKAERARPPAEGTRFEGVVSDAETLLTELSVELDAPKLRADIPGAVPSPAATVGGQEPGGLTKDIVDALRKQLETGKAGEGFTPEMLEALEKQVDTGKSSTTTVKIPAPKPAPAPEGASPEEP
jgi:tetratricopeptide (TPR) repeat protein